MVFQGFRNWFYLIKKYILKIIQNTVNATKTFQGGGWWQTQTHFSSIFRFYNSWKFQKTKVSIGLKWINSALIETYWYLTYCTKTWSFPLRISSVNMTKSADADLVTFTEEIFNVKLHFLCSVHVTLSSNIRKS